MKIMKSCLPIVRYAPPLIIEISIFTKMVRIRASPPSASRAASSYPARKFSNNFPKFEDVAKFWKVQNLQNRIFCSVAKNSKHFFLKIPKKFANLGNFFRTFCKSCKIFQTFCKSLQSLTNCR